MTAVAILRAAPIATNAESMDPEAVTHFEMYARDALHPHPGRELTDIPVRIDHNRDVSVGRVTGLRVDTCVGGPSGTWQYVHVEFSDPPPWLRRGTPVSISRAAYQSRTPWDADWLLVQKAILTEVSILSPGKKPAHPAACVEWMGERETPKPAEAQRSPTARTPQSSLAPRETWTSERSSTVASSGSSGQDAPRTSSSASRTCKTSYTAVASSANTHAL
jgi:hypothetical protein